MLQINNPRSFCKKISARPVIEREKSSVQAWNSPHDPIPLGQ